MHRTPLRVLVGVTGLLLSSGCAGIPPAQMGQTVGTIAGAAIAPGVGAPLGALVGLLAGMVVQGETDKVTEKRERRELSDQLAVGSAARVGRGQSPGGTHASAPQGDPARVWVDETAQDGRLVAGHFEARNIP